MAAAKSLTSEATRPTSAPRSAHSCRRRGAASLAASVPYAAAAASHERPFTSWSAAPAGAVGVGVGGRAVAARRVLAAAGHLAEREVHAAGEALVVGEARL